MEQLEFFKPNKSKQYGGSHRGHKRKTIRPLDKKRLHHMVAKSQHAKGIYSFKNICHRQRIESLIYEKARIYGVRIAELVNVGNHFHLLIRFEKPHLVRNFFRVTLGMIARIVTKAQKGKRFGRFWDGIVFTRIISKGIDEARIFEYLIANKLESALNGEMRKVFQQRRKAYWQKFKKQFIRSTD